jgi:dienelactone hydrolase
MTHHRHKGFVRFGVSFCLGLLAGLLSAVTACAQAQLEQVEPLLGEEILPPRVAVFQLQQYLLGRVVPPPVARDAAAWTAEAKRLRAHMLNEVAFHGWPREWVNAPPKFEDLGVFATGPGYRMRKLRYEIVPGFESTAILYEPENLRGKIPAILNVNGHVGPPGKAVEYKQKRCINFAKRGVMALNLEWLGMGELSQHENQHWFAVHMDFVGTHELGLFVLAMRKGLDYLYNHPSVDRTRLGMTGLSGGGWQTMMLSALDERVVVSVPVAGFSSNRSRVEARYYGDMGDPEQFPTDLYDGVDLPHMVALRAPRPTLLVYNAEDDACFRAAQVKPYIYDAVAPIFKSYGKEGIFGWHENTDFPAHNYQLDNRLQAYAFFTKFFHLKPVEGEIPSDAEIKSFDELAVGLPKDNLTILDLARKLAKGIQRTPEPSAAAARAQWVTAERNKLRRVVRYKAVDIRRTWIMANSKNTGLETLSYLFEMQNGLSANGLWLKAIASPDRAPATIVLHDQGRKAAGAEVVERVNHGEQVLALDLMFMGNAWSEYTQGPFNAATGPCLYEQILHGVGDRPLGMEAAQLITVARWLKGRSGTPKVRLDITGIRNQVVALTAAALAPDLFSDLVVHEGMKSLDYILDKPVEFQDAPEVFCLDFYKEFDLDRIAKFAAPARVTVEKNLSLSGK